jgi:hypothetical protein
MAIKYLFADSIRKAFCLTGLVLVLMAAGAAVADGQETDGSTQVLTQKELVDRLTMYRDGNRNYVAQWWGVGFNDRYSSSNGSITFMVNGTYSEVVDGPPVKGNFVVTETEITFEKPGALPVSKRYTLEGDILTLTEENGTVRKFRKSHW